MNLLLSRHGNTFGPNDPVVWAGATNDLPLVEKGLAQAEKLAAALLAQKIIPAAVYCGPLQRTSRYASIVMQKIGLQGKPTVDRRLNEIDYGEWTGLTNEQVIARFGEAALKAWDEHARWPEKGGWGGSEKSAIAEVHSFIDDLTQKHREDDTIIVVTSNGRLRYFLTLVEGEFERRAQTGAFKVKTGNICKLRQQSGLFSVSCWNAEPSALAALA